MADNKEARDEKLIEELYERLWWYTHEASDEEFDEKEVDAITRLLDVLEPVHDDQAFASGADAALKRFWERYGEEEEDAGLAEAAGASDAASPDLPGKDTVPPCPSPNRSGWKKRFLRLGIGLAAYGVAQGMARQPEVQGRLFTVFILGSAFVEALALIGFVVSLIVK